MLSTTNIINMVNSYQVYICPNLLLLVALQTGLQNAVQWLYQYSNEELQDTILAMHCYRHECQDIASPTFINLLISSAGPSS